MLFEGCELKGLIIPLCWCSGVGEGNHRSVCCAQMCLGESALGHHGGKEVRLLEGDYTSTTYRQEGRKQEVNLGIFLYKADSETK